MSRRSSSVIVAVAVLVIAGIVGLPAIRARRRTPRATIVAVLGRPVGSGPVPVGSSAILSAEVVSALPVTEVAFLADGKTLAVDHLSTPVTSTVSRFGWSPGSTGDHLLLVEVTDKDGNSALSNPLHLDGASPSRSMVMEEITTNGHQTLSAIAKAKHSTLDLVEARNPELPAKGPLPPGTSVVVPVPSSVPTPSGTSPEGTAAVLSVDTGGSSRTTAPPATPGAKAPGAPGVPAAGGNGTPTVTLSTEGCTLSITVHDPGATGTAEISKLPPGAGDFAPAGSVRLGSSGGTVTEPLPPGKTAYTASIRTPEGTVVSNVAVSTGSADCGPTATKGKPTLVGGMLHTDSDVDHAYLYVQGSNGGWVRVPSTPGELVAKTAEGFDFGPYLPLLPDNTFRFEAWGRHGGALEYLGTGTWIDSGAPASSLVSLEMAIPIPDGTVWDTTGTISSPDTRRFRVSTPLPQVDGLLWQVSARPFVGDAVDQPVLAAGVVDAYRPGDPFTIDFSTFWHPTQDETVTESAQALRIDPKKGLRLDTSAPGVSRSGGPASTVPQRFYVRTVPLEGGKPFGAVTNPVVLDVSNPPPLELHTEVPTTFHLDSYTFYPPRLPDPHWTNCVYVEENPYLTDPSKVADAISAGNVSAGLYAVAWPLHKTVCPQPKKHKSGGLLGALEDVWNTLVGFWNTLTEAYAWLKAQVVKLAASIVQCDKLPDFGCKQLLGAALDGALLAVGIPPSLPNYDQLVEAGKGKLVDFAVEQATNAGVPCDEADLVGVSCKDIVRKALDGVIEAVKEAQSQATCLTGDAAKEEGVEDFCPPPGVIVKPDPRGVLQPPTLIVNATKESGADDSSCHFLVHVQVTDPDWVDQYGHSWGKVVTQPFQPEYFFFPKAKVGDKVTAVLTLTDRHFYTPDTWPWQTTTADAWWQLLQPGLPLQLSTDSGACFGTTKSPLDQTMKVPERGK